jgi:hypothetical protein
MLCEEIEPVKKAVEFIVMLVDTEGRAKPNMFGPLTV